MLEILVLSLVQGITEFLPISSSSHLIVFSEQLNFKSGSLSIDVSLHIGSFIAVIVFFRKDILGFLKNKELFSKIFVSSIPVILVGYLLVKSNFIEKLRIIEIIGWTTIVFAILLYISDKYKLNKNLKNNFNFKSAILIGMLQILSLIPGVSRSGVTITAARLLNFNRFDSSKISFLMSIPILGAVSIYGLNNIFVSKDLNFSTMNITSIFLSFVFSYLTIKFFLGYVKKFNMNVFVIYRVILGTVLLFLAYL